MRQCTLASLVVCAAYGCGNTKPAPTRESDDAGAKAVPAEPVKGKPPITAKPPRVFADGGDEDRALLRLRSLPAWSGVLERYRLLARRNQSGVLHGLMVDHEGRWRLVDESEGAGSLSIPVEIPASIKLRPPLRAVLWGAWHMDDAGDFVWRATRVESLSTPRPAPKFSPGLQARDQEVAEEVAEAVVPASAVSKRGGGIFFVVVDPPERYGDGWRIADAPGGAPVARLLLPGERPTYGDQTQVTESERWQLTPKSYYWLEIGRFRPPGDGTLPVYHAATPPFAYAPPELESSP
jgi:hypothetical protein